MKFIVPELNDLYSGWVSKEAWRVNCHKKVIDDKVVYLEILRMFIEYLEEDRGNGCKDILHTSFNEKYGRWSRRQNAGLYAEIDKLWKTT